MKIWFSIILAANVASHSKEGIIIKQEIFYRVSTKIQSKDLTLILNLWIVFLGHTADSKYFLDPNIIILQPALNPICHI